MIVILLRDLILGTAEGTLPSNPSTARSAENERGQASAATTISFDLRKYPSSVHLCADSPCYAPDARHAYCGCPRRGARVSSNGGPSTDVHTVPYRDGSTRGDTCGSFRDHTVGLSSAAT